MWSVGSANGRAIKIAGLHPRGRILPGSPQRGDLRSAGGRARETRAQLRRETGWNNGQATQYRKCG
jgi:hypothetical protein